MSGKETTSEMRARIARERQEREAVHRAEKEQEAAELERLVEIERAEEAEQKEKEAVERRAAEEAKKKAEKKTIKVPAKPEVVVRTTKRMQSRDKVCDRCNKRGTPCIWPGAGSVMNGNSRKGRSPMLRPKLRNELRSLRIEVLGSTTELQRCPVESYVEEFDFGFRS